MRGEELPDGLSLSDQMAYTALRNTYRAYYDKTISRDAAAAEKQRIRLAWERAVSRAAFDQRLTTYHVKVIRETEAAKNAFRKDPTPANALRLCNAMDGLPQDLQEQLLSRAQECRKSVLVITTNGFQMPGIITGSDRFVIALKGDGRLQMVYKHAISMIVLTEERS